MKTTLNEYLGKLGLQFIISDYTIDKMRIPHGLTQGKKEELLKNTVKNAAGYSEKRAKAIKEYYQKIESGELVEKTIEEQIIDRANGHPDKESTQAARRVAKKRGIEWQRIN